VKGGRSVPNDPTRPTRILDAALDVIAEHGLHRASHRLIAQAAGVSPGSLTYYYAGIDDIYARAFQRLTEQMSSRYEESMARADDPGAAASAVADLICGGYAEHRSMVLIFEMYAYANHNADVAALTAEWTVRSRRSLSRHFSPTACRAIDALVEGWPMHREFERRELDHAEVTATILAIAGAWPRTAG
jgi:DNA-binding transcriptional regulator YbjK